MDMGLSKLCGILKDQEVWRAAVHGITKSQTRVSNCTDPESFTFPYTLWIQFVIINKITFWDFY